MSKAVKMTKEEFRTLQLLELDLIVELDRVCRKHDIKYCITCGTLLGAVRHKGYIPWDDDADVAMLREEYEKFKKVANELNPDICYFHDHSVDPEYLWGYGKLRRVGTTFVRVGQEHMKGQTGVCIDIFPLDDAPMNLPGQMLQDFYCFCLRKILWARVGKINSRGFSRMVYNVISHIPVEWVYARVNAMIKCSKNSKPNRVRTLLFPSFGKLYLKNPASVRYGMPKKWFTDRSEFEFEGYKFYGTKDYDRFLKYVYDDYMTIPPKNKRQPHALVSSFHFTDPISGALTKEEHNERDNISGGKIE